MEKMLTDQLIDYNNYNKQLLDEVEHDIMNYQNRGLCYLPKPKAEADNTDKRFWWFVMSCENRFTCLVNDKVKTIDNMIDE